MGGPMENFSPKRVSASEVARRAGVSTAAVSYVMNNKPGVAAETRRRVLAVAAELGFKPNNASMAFGLDRTGVIGLVLPNISNPVFPRFAQGVIAAAAEEGHDVFVATTQDDADTLSKIVSTLVARNVDGVILAAALREDATAMRTLRTARIPYVYLSRKSPYLEGDFVGIDDFAAASELMEHILSHGYDSIASVCGPRHSTSSLAREQAFVQTAAARGVAIPSHHKISTQLNNEGGRAAAERIFAGARPPRAIVCGSDAIAIGIMEYAMDHGIRVPHDVVVAGSDGLPLSISRLIDLTTIVQPHVEMARESFAMLLKRMKASSTQYQSLLLQHWIKIGRTCGCDPAVDRGRQSGSELEATGSGHGG
ncbi:MAG: LacI family transcriptional regulator [Actinomycetota bacterium]|nr:LacI family transcriptional regulator [Actinomycetota bacterium]